MSGTCFPTFDRCVEWTGQDIPELGIKTGDRLDVVLGKMMAQLVAYSKPIFDVSPINGDVALKTIGETTELLVRNAAATDAAKVNYDGPSYGLDLGQSSSDLYALQGRSFIASVAATQTGSQVGIDLAGAVSGMPAGYSLDSVRTLINGSRSGGTTVIADTNRQVFSVAVNNDRFPLNVDVEAIIKSPNGVLRLRRNFTMAASNPLEEFMYLEASSLAQGIAGVVPQADFNDAVAAEVSKLRNQLDQLNNMGIVGATSVDLAGASLSSSISAIVAKLDEHDATIKDISTVTVPVYTPSGTVYETLPLTEAVATVATQTAQVSGDSAVIASDVEVLKNNA